MASSVLGKRARTLESNDDFSSISSRVKRRALLHHVNDENADPTAISNVRGIAECDDGCMELDELDESSPTPSKSSRRAQSAVNRPVGKARVALSPRKANGEINPSESAIDNETVVQLPTPKTPRHRDALSKRVPITPRHRVGLIGKPLTPRTPRTPRTPSTPSHVPSVYNAARQLFTTSTDPGRLIGREEERQELHALLRKGIDSNSGRCIYVSGPPGTGKSALVGEVCREFQGMDGVKTAYINCMSVKSSDEIYTKLMDKLSEEPILEQNAMAELRAMFFPKKKSADTTYVVTLDEIDHLLTLDLEILYTLFEWALHRSSRLVVIGIANALDLTDRFLPRLKARNLKPPLLPFLPYTAPQIASVITAKLRSLTPASPTNQDGDEVPFVHPAAIQLCSKKVASQTGDLRKAFDIIRRTIDLIETETKQKYLQTQQSPFKLPLSENTNLSSPPQTSQSFASLTSLTAPRATIAHISRISAAAFNNGTSQRLQTLNLQQKVALCALIAYQKTSAQKLSRLLFNTPSKKPPTSPTVRQLHESYSGLCKRENALHPLSATEFADVIGGLETLGLVGEETKGGKGGFVGGTPKGRRGVGMGVGRGEDRRLVCFVDEGELGGCLGGVGGEVLRGLLWGGEL